MKELVLTLGFFLLLSAGCWILVFKKSARHKLQRGAWRLYRLKSEEQREAYDAMHLASVLVLALVFSICFFLTLVLAVVRGDP